MPITFFEYESEIIAIETCGTGDGGMRVGVGPTQIAAVDNLETIALPGYLDARKGPNSSFGS